MNLKEFVRIVLKNLSIMPHLLVTLFMSYSFAIHADDNYIIVHKQNVKHAFVPFDATTDHFTKNVFANWEKETFEVFDQVKDPNGIAIDLGAWIGTTAIWCCKNFSHVVAVDADPVSLQCLQNNLKASECFNVTTCPRPVAETSEQFIFGPRGPVLNESISYIKNESNNPNDYRIQGITFKQLIHDFVYENDAIKNKKISFIKCDIEGGEENILEDILYFAYHNNVKAYISFHLDWWKNKNIHEFEYLFKFFKTNCPSSDIVTYIKQNPFTSILFEPLDNAGTLIKKNMPVVIIGYNQYTYIKNMVAQLEKYTSDIIIIDNNSSFEPLLNYYANDFKYTLLRQKINHGHTVVSKNFIQNLVGDVYLMTDPDLKFNNNLPHNFIETLLEISNYFKAHKVGFALFIDSDQIRTDVFYKGHDIKEWESAFWEKPLHYPNNSSLELYEAPIDTTFCLVNKKFMSGAHIRIAGDYTCLHLPWFKDFKDSITPNEYETYLKNNVSTSWFRSY
ncbi:MAG: FkbM family methyltransferase [Candidatus Babeliales bacterium]|jgi:FkbM family methyltransferase